MQSVSFGPLIRKLIYINLLTRLFLTPLFLAPLLLAPSAFAVNWAPLDSGTKTTTSEKAAPAVEEAPEEAAAEPIRLKQNRPVEMVTGVVIGIRRKKGTEILMKNVKEPVLIPFLSYHNKIFNRCLDSQKKGKPVTLRIDQESRQVLDDAIEQSTMDSGNK
jgi:hypothetical protein